MNNLLNREIAITRKGPAIIVLLIALALGLTGWFVLRNFAAPTPSASEITSTPTLSSEATPTPQDYSPADGAAVLAALTDNDAANDNITDSFGRNNFLRMLVSQMGSEGEIIDGALSTFAYYTEWYIGGYPGNTGWNKDTPWCASYISWCLEQVSLSVRSNVPRYANVDHFMQHFFADTWLERGNTPTPGDLIFFGYLNDPNHMGVVIAADENYVHTIEGNVNDTIALRKYTIDDPNILGYGLLNWKN